MHLIRRTYITSPTLLVACTWAICVSLLQVHNGIAAEIPSRYFYESEQGGCTACTEGQRNNKLTENSVPLQFYKALDNVTDMYEFFEHFVDKEKVDPQLGLSENIKRNVERAASVRPKPATCMAENTVVPLLPLHPVNSPEIIYYPKCTRVKRCNGCCTSDLMSCQPTEIEKINFEVVKYNYEKQAPIGREVINVEQHLKCRCDCRIKEQDCKSYQIYRADRCGCECTNEDARQKCLSEPHKIWDEQKCRCVCRENQSCTTGLIFDDSQCQCIENPNGSSSDQSTSTSLADRRRFIVKAVPVELNESTIYLT